MKKVIPASSPEAYAVALSGWQRAKVEQLRAAVLGSAPLDEVIKWGHLVYVSNGPVLLIRAEETACFSASGEGNVFEKSIHC